MYSNRVMPKTCSEAVSPVLMVCTRFNIGNTMKSAPIVRAATCSGAWGVSSEMLTHRRQGEATIIEHGENTELGKCTHDTVHGVRVGLGLLRELGAALRTISQEIGDAKLGSSSDHLGWSSAGDETAQCIVDGRFVGQQRLLSG